MKVRQKYVFLRSLQLEKKNTDNDCRLKIKLLYCTMFARGYTRAVR